MERERFIEKVIWMIEWNGLRWFLFESEGTYGRFNAIVFNSALFHTDESKCGAIESDKGVASDCEMFGGRGSYGQAVRAGGARSR